MKKRTAATLVGRVVVLTEDGAKAVEGWRKFSPKATDTDRTSPLTKLYKTEGEVVGVWREEGDTMLQVRVLGGDYVGELVNLTTVYVLVVRDSVDPGKADRTARRAELIEVAAHLFASNSARASNATGAAMLAAIEAGILLSEIDKALA